MMNDSHVTIKLSTVHINFILRTYIIPKYVQKTSQPNFHSQITRQTEYRESSKYVLYIHLP